MHLKSFNFELDWLFFKSNWFWINYQSTSAGWMHHFPQTKGERKVCKRGTIVLSQHVVVGGLLFRRVHLERTHPTTGVGPIHWWGLYFFPFFSNIFCQNFTESHIISFLLLLLLLLLFFLGGGGHVALRFGAIIF